MPERLEAGDFGHGPHDFSRFFSERNFTAAAPNRVWVSDITYIPTDEGWLYMAGLKDLFNGELVGYAMSERMTKNLVMQALFRGVSAKRPAKGLTLHSDRGAASTARMITRGC